MEKSIIGENAGIIWRTLENKGRLSYDQLQAETELEPAAMFAAIGWLAREDKISFLQRTELHLFVCIRKLIIS